MVVTKPTSKGKFKFKQQTNLKTSSLQEEDGHKFRLICTECVLACQTSSQQEKSEWLNVFQTVVNEARESLLKSAFVDEESFLCVLYNKERLRRHQKVPRSIVNTYSWRTLRSVKLLWDNWRKQKKITLPIWITHLRLFY